MKSALRLVFTVVLLLPVLVAESHAHALSVSIRQIPITLVSFGYDWPSSSAYAYDAAMGSVGSRRSIQRTLGPIADERSD